MYFAALIMPQLVKRKKKNVPKVPFQLLFTKLIHPKPRKLPIATNY